MSDFLHQLQALIQDRKATLPEGSYTTQLFQGGLDRILKKIGEEAGEVIIAAKNNDKTELANESADLLYHLIVTWTENGLSIDDVLDVLKSRHTLK